MSLIQVNGIKASSKDVKCYYQEQNIHYQIIVINTVTLYNNDIQYTAQQEKTVFQKYIYVHITLS